MRTPLALREENANERMPGKTLAWGKELEWGRGRRAWILAAAAGLLGGRMAAQDSCEAQLQQLIALTAPPASDRAAAQFYVSHGCSCIWVRESTPSVQARAAQAALADAAGRGLRAEDYRAPLWNGTFDAGSFEFRLTAVLLRFGAGLCDGRRPAGGESRCDLAGWLRRLATAPDITPVLDETEPPFDGYRRLKAALNTYRVWSRQTSTVPLPLPPKPLDSGDTYTAAGPLAEHLRLLGDLRAEAPSPRNEVYEGELVEAVKRFQFRHGLAVDGRIGPETMRQLNVPPSQRLRQLELTMERWRRMPRAMAHPPVVVNIPEFRLRAYGERQEVQVEMNVVVGRTHSHHTPLLQGEIRGLIFHPFWDVPPRIQRDELLPAAAKNPAFLQDNGYEAVTAGGTVVPASPETLALLHQGKLFLRQRPGPLNALGAVKLDMPNASHVYLHDTPARSLFTRPRRDFSHGCVRLENAAALAAWLLRHRPDWTRERVEAAMRPGGRTQRVPLAQPVPVFIVYGTAVAPENGAPRFFEDLYGLDAQLERELRE